MMILALDLGKFNTMCCFFDSETRKHEFIVAETQREYLAKIFKLKNVDVVVMTACSPSEYWKGQLDSELSQLDALVKQLGSAEKPLEEIAKKDPRIIRLMTIPGVGRTIGRNGSQWQNYQAWIRARSCDSGGMCMVLDSLQPMGENGVRTYPRQAKDTQEEGCNSVGT